MDVSALGVAVKPLLKWAGGKARLAAQIAEVFDGPCAGTYLEPFLGSGAVFLHLKAAGLVGEAILSDANPKLAAVHVAVRDRVDDVLAELERLPSDDWQERYYEVREWFNQGPHRGPAHAARFLWLNRAGYNGLYRENRSGRFNVPVGRYSALRLPDPARFRQVSAALQGVEILDVSFEDVMRRAGQGDHVYCDPPYVPLSETACFTGYCSRVFGLAEQRHLATTARKAAMSGARVVLSNHDLPIVRNELYRLDDGFQHVARPRVARAISRGARGSVHEMIARIGPLPATVAA